MLNRFTRSKWQSKIDAICEKELKKENKASLRILMGPSFSIWEPSQALDRTLALALGLRGCEIIPVYCDSMQEAECNCVGGNWGGGDDWIKNCRNCRQASEKMWLPYKKNLVKLSSYGKSKDKKTVSNLVNGLSFNSLLNFRYENINYGNLGADILVNNYLVASPNLVPNGEKLLRTHIENLLQLNFCYRRLLEDLRPDRVISNDSYYGMWRVLESLCADLGIPYYSHWPVTKNRIAIAHNDAAMNLDFRESWAAFSKQSLESGDYEKIKSWLSGNRGLHVDTTKPSANSSSDLTEASIDTEKPTVLLAANVIWDLAALNKQIVFQDMNQWIVETIRWFEKRPNYQLIIKPHPGETAPDIPRTNETVEKIIETEFDALPSNVILLESSSSFTSDAIMNQENVRGAVVHTTTVGFEFPAHGLPTITTARSPYRGFGFTLDPADKKEYFAYLQNLLQSKREQIDYEDKELALKFIKFYQFHYFSNITAFDGNPVQLSDDFDRIIDSSSGSLHYIVSQIVAGKAINNAHQWLPET